MSTTFANYEDTLKWMFNKLPMYQRIGGAAYKADLNNTILLLDHLNHPEKQFKTVHIAGTNGKGSVSHMLASILAECGYKTGLYTSPHLRDFRERIRINGQMISQEYVMDFVKRHVSKFEEMDLSFFEMTVGMAFQYFADEKVDVAIIETGMGGRLDSTNVIQPLLSVITNISLDHTQYLGTTLEAIAAEKAGIIKQGVLVVIGQTQAETTAVFENKALEMNAPIVFADRVFDANRLQTSDVQVQSFDVWKNSQLYFEELELPLLGAYQQKNLVTAICAADMLKVHFQLDEKDIRYGLEAVVRNTGLSGRWQVVSRNPLAIADTGHNVDGIREVIYQIRLMQFNQLHFVLGMVNDKSIEDILQLLPRHATYYFCKADIPRGLDAEALASQAFEIGLRGRVYESVRSAYFSALNAARPDDLVFVGGSTFVVAEIV